MSRAAVLSVALAVMACSGPSSTVPTGFAPACPMGPAIVGEAEMGVGSTDRRGGTGVISDVDATLVLGGRTADGHCVGASLGTGER